MDRSLAAYLPQDRRAALARGESLPEHSHGTALFADISGFTSLTEALDRALGTRRGVETMTDQINQVYDTLVAEIERFGGSVIGFAGDSITCWFKDRDWEMGDRDWGTGSLAHPLTSKSQLPTPASLRATACALALQQAMYAFAAIPLPNGTTTALALKVALASGLARRLAVGDPAVQLFDVLVGAPLTYVALGEHLARPGEVLLDEATATVLGEAISVAEWRISETGDRFAVVTELQIELTIAVAQSAIDNLESAMVRPWLLPAIYNRHQAGLGEFLTELRPAVALFLRFSGLDYDGDTNVGEKLDNLIRRVQQILVRYDGTLLQLTIGDKGSYLYVAFGAPTAHEDDPRRAARAALECLALPEELQFLTPLQIGISRGVLRVGACGSRTRRTYVAMGDEVNLAARLMGRAAPGEILVSGRVRSALADAFALEPLEPISLKGMPEPLPVFRLAGIRPRDVRLTEPAYALPMVGRQAELAQITAKLNLALAGQGQVVGIVAEAGMGKSRLLAEAVRLARRNGLRSFGGACQSYGTNTPYLVWEAIWRAFFDINPEVSIRRQLRTLEGIIEEWAPERMEALPLLGPLLGLNLPENDFTKNLEPQYRKSALEALLLDCLRAAAREAAEDGSGLLFVLEDLHWIDAASHELLERTAQESTTLPILIVLAYRPPELLRLQTPRIEVLAHFSRIELAPLSEAETAQAIRAKLAQLLPERKGAATPALLARITAKAQGNPFYVEELLNYLRDRGIDPQDTAAVEALDLPSSLHTLILSRIDQLSARQQAELKIASVIGRLFQFTYLHGAFPILGAPEPLKADLNELARLELTPLDTPEPELAYLFKHIVTQEVAYESLTVQARAGLHEQLAVYLEQRVGDDSDRFVDLLAYHYERSDNLAKKREYLRRAGEAAAARFANDAAIDYLSRALKLVLGDDLTAQYDLLLAREQVYALQAAREQEAQDIAALEALAGRLGDDRRRAEVALRRAAHTHDTGAYAEAVAAAAQAGAWATAAGDVGLVAESYYLGGTPLVFAGQYEAAQAQFRQALELARVAGRTDLEMKALLGVGLVAPYDGDYSTAHALITQALALARTRGDPQGECHALIGIGDTAKKIGLYRDAHVALEQSLTLARTIGGRLWETYALQNLATLAATKGDYERAADYAAQTHTLAQAIGEPNAQAFALALTGHGLTGLAHWDVAANAYRQSCDLYTVIGRSDLAAEPLAGLARLALAQGHIAQAMAHVDLILAQIETRHLEGAEEPLRVDLTCYQVLHAAHDLRAYTVLERAYSRLQEQAAKITDEAMRYSFLQNVPYHCEIVAAWAAGSVAPTS